MISRYLALCAPLALLAGAGCGKKDEKKNAAPPPTPVSVVTAHVADAVYYDQYPATATALRTVELRPQVSGYITALSFQEGTQVAAGQVLYEIDKRQYEAAYQQALASVQSAKATASNAQVNKARYQRLLQEDAVARQLAENAVTNASTAGSQVAGAEAALNIAQTNLSFATIRAPFAGRIGISQVRLGQQVSAGNTLLNTISNENPMGVDFQVNQQDLARFQQLLGRSVAKGDSTIRLVLPDGTVYPQPGRVAVIGRSVDPQTGTITVRAEFDNAQRRITDGMSVVVKVLNQQSGNRLVVPNRAIIEQMGENFVYVAQGDSAHQQKVQLGPRLRDNIVVMSGLQDGQQIITDGVQKLRDGGKIQVGPPGTLPGGAAGAATGGAAGK